MEKPVPVRRPLVLHCVSHLALGGAERVAVTLMQALHDDFDFAVYAVRGVAHGNVAHALRDELAAADIPLVVGPRIPMRWGGMLTGGIGLARTVQRLRPNLVHLHTEIPEVSFAAATLVQPGLEALPLVRTIHNAVIWRFSPWLGRLVDRRIAHAHVTGVSDDAVNAFLALRQSSGAAKPAQAPVTIYNGVRFELKSRPAPSDPSVIRMVYGGRFEPEKGTDLLPEIVRRTQLPAGVRATLTIFGSGKHEPALRSLERHAPAGWTVEIRAPIVNFSAELSSFDLMLVPSRHEGLSLVAIEGLLAGIQVVATDAPGLREALPASHPWRARAGDAASFAAALQFACGNRERWPAISALGQDFARRCFDPELMAQGYRELYARALSTAKTPFVRER